LKIYSNLENYSSAQKENESAEADSELAHPESPLKESVMNICPRIRFAPENMHSDSKLVHSCLGLFQQIGAGKLSGFVSKAESQNSKIQAQSSSFPISKLQNKKKQKKTEKKKKVFFHFFSSII
jgi:hypothetical protein